MDAILVVKTTLVLSGALLAAPLLRRAAPVTRHRYWSATFAAVHLLPLLILTVPAFGVPLPFSQNRAVQAAVISPIHRPLSPSPFSESTPAQGGPPSAIDSDSVYSPPRESAFSLTTVIGATWILGACLAIAALVVSLVRVARLQREAAEIHDVAWRATARAVGVRLGWRRRVRLLVSDNVSTPMAGGIWRPTVFLPSACHGWTATHRRVVLAHEIAHLASSDPVRHLMTRLAVAIYWFHPLAWLAARRADVAREEACDAAVLALGTRPSVYARVLLDLAESTAGGPRLLACCR